jgi:hypothetical protein
VAIRTLSLQEFDKFRSARTAMARRLTAQAVEWFVDDAATVLGAIAYDARDLDWSFVILGRDTHGQFRALDRDIGLYDLDKARRLLVEKMALAMAINKEVSVRNRLRDPVVQLCAD